MVTYAAGHKPPGLTFATPQEQMESELEAAMAADAAAAAETADGNEDSTLPGTDAPQEEQLHRLSFTGEGIDFGGDAPVLELRETPVSLSCFAADVLSCLG